MIHLIQQYFEITKRNLNLALVCYNTIVNAKFITYKGLLEEHLQYKPHKAENFIFLISILPNSLREVFQSALILGL